VRAAVLWCNANGAALPINGTHKRHPHNTMVALMQAHAMAVNAQQWAYRYLSQYPRLLYFRCGTATAQRTPLCVSSLACLQDGACALTPAAPPRAAPCWPQLVLRGALQLLARKQLPHTASRVPLPDTASEPLPRAGAH
jgi:hypothetical protein